MTGKWNQADEEKAKQIMPEQVVEDAQEACTTLATFALFLRIAKKADIENTPVIQEATIGTEDIEEMEEEKAHFRITIQQIPELTEEI